LTPNGAPFLGWAIKTLGLSRVIIFGLGIVVEKSLIYSRAPRLAHQLQSHPSPGTSLVKALRIH
jgi:hypothetical protein